MENTIGTKAKCQNCNYEWLTRSKLGFICCPNCNYKVKNPKGKMVIRK